MKSHFLLIISVGVLITSFSNCDKPLQEEKVVLEKAKDNDLEKTLTHFLFIGKWYGKNGVYNYNLTERKYKTVWWHPRENVILLVAKPGEYPAFFLTGGKMGMRGNFPFFEKIKIFRISTELSRIENIYKIEGGMQITSRWNEDGNLEVVFTSIDNTDPSYINKYRKTFDNYGRLINDEIETFNLINDGFPELLPKRNPTISTSGKYGVSIIGDTVFFKSVSSDSLFFITEPKHSVNKIVWSEDENFLFISTLDLRNATVKTRSPETSELFIYSLSADSIIDVFGGAGLKNFFTMNELLIFDTGFGSNSQINIYDVKQRKVIDVIKPREGCGLITLPLLPDGN